MRTGWLVLAGALVLGCAAGSARTREHAAEPTDARRPARPRVELNLAPPEPRGQVHVVRAGGDFQAALDAARPGDVIELEAGATFVGPFTLSEKCCEGWIVIRSSAVEDLPPPGERATPADAARMPVLESARDVVLAGASGAHHYWLQGLELRPRPGVFLYNLVQLGNGETSAGRLPHHIVFDRCYLHGDPEAGTRRGIALNAAAAAVIDSHLSDFKEVDRDSQAIAAWNGPGPFAIENNYLEAAGENLLFGGADPTVDGLVPSDIRVRRNHFSKPLSWRVGHPEYDGTPWAVKNLFELKNARRVEIDGNFFEHNWPHAQNGFAILFTVRNQDGGAPWSVVEDVTFTNNIVRRVGAGINILGQDDLQPSRRTARILIRNNLMTQIGGPWGSGRLFQLLDGVADVIVERNTALNTGSFLVATRAAHPRFVFRGNIVRQPGRFEGHEFGFEALRRYFPDAVVTGNVIVTGDPPRGLDQNVFLDSLSDVGFADAAGGDYRLAAASPLRRSGTGGRDIGADIDALRAAQTVRR